MAKTFERKTYSLSDGSWTIDWLQMQGLIRRRAIAVDNVAALATGTKRVSGGIALFGRDLEEIDIDFDGIRQSADKTSESLVATFADTCAKGQQTGEGLRNYICTECACDHIHSVKFQSALAATNRKNLAVIQSVDSLWEGAIGVTRVARDLAVDGFFSIGAIAFPAPGIWQAGHIAVKAGITCHEKGSAKATTGLVTDVVVSFAPKQLKLGVEFFFNSARDTGNGLIDGEDFSDAVIAALVSNAADQSVKTILQSGQVKSWLSRKVIPVRIDQAGHTQRRELVDVATKLSGKGTSKLGQLAVGAVMNGGTTVRAVGQGSMTIGMDQFRPIAESIVARA